jgi:hypothetical protein
VDVGSIVQPFQRAAAEIQCRWNISSGAVFHDTFVVVVIFSRSQNSLNFPLSPSPNSSLNWSAVRKVQ